MVVCVEETSRHFGFQGSSLTFTQILESRLTAGTFRKLRQIHKL